jgi:hypothetical protein
VEDLVRQTNQTTEGALGSPGSLRRRLYERLKTYLDCLPAPNAADADDLRRCLDQLYKYPLLESVRDKLARHLKGNPTDQQLADMLVAHFLDGRLCNVREELAEHEPQIVCSLGLS